ncbi:histidine kinase [Parabacteroides sp. PF5-6]|uniref:sensor histidine kinase n=1 Tax=Parabacteroides sp. PF5-6 TaxID=1742403 RepID=UPI002406DC1D|nr:histidine kinase [Parabacteroides sp. PF5-6]MDF9831235.1 hypothetical protein [Parabacteroides sp. PF5-6]
MQRFFCFLCFCAITIIIAISFSKTLFQKTIRSQKTVPFVVKFIAMVTLMAVGLLLVEKAFYILEIKGFFNSTYYSVENIPDIKRVGDMIPGLIACNLVFCVVLLYYEYTVLQQTNLEAQLKLLHAQINPHFMFNVLNYLYVLMQKDTDLASTLLLKYSDVLRYQLYSGEKGTVKLDQEIQFLKDFIDVEKFRWEDKLDVACSWTMDNPNKDIPPLLLMPFVENAFKHVSRSPSNKGFIHILFEQKNNQLYLDIENSRSDKPVKKKSTGIGLENVKARLEILYGQRYSLTIKESDALYQVKLKLYL